jgi:hypothetical protein
MKRIEIVVNQAVEEEVIELLTDEGHGDAFTYTHPVYGRGGSGRREGSAVWPETNSLFVVYTNDDTGKNLLAGVKHLKTRFPKEGIKAWSITFDAANEDGRSGAPTRIACHSSSRSVLSVR